MNNYQVYLFDLDGTVYAGSRPIQSTIAYINYLIKQGKKVLMVSNNATVTEKHVKDKLENFGVAVAKIEVATSAMATAFHLQKNDITKAFIVGATALKDICADRGIFHDENNPEAVLVGLDKEATYSMLATAAEILQKSDLPFIATNYDLRLAATDYFLPGAGTIVNLIETASAQKATVIGKPHKPMMEYLEARLSDYDKSSWIMIGDNYATDILFGINNGIDTCFIETGVHTLEYIENQTLQPTYAMTELTKLLISE